MSIREQIREKTERSVPMSISGMNRFSNSTGDLSYTETDSGTKSRPRSRLTPGTPGSGSRPGSRPSSRPQSRAASDMCSESLDGYQQRKTTKYTPPPAGMKRQSSFGRTTPSTNGSKDRWH
ncbi:microtubule-actin cross-linking factor 1:-like isoforms 1/2/3/5 [Leptotrombidium deliense]|uniref:Microtubule-actin cross-linking factor 1:-like isoforms 1/2/3/5 n=1 Tax=Leptotrombidium deliense TaxID=299467 RepID=A0A443SKA0_9ACAR|nr:microtubule-actin cross-linking factor 1:-like isoforms 1/2/3/5 [Leptotrombidium deliense]